MGEALSPPQPIRPEHDTASFRCGQPTLDDWLQNRALRSEGRSARTYVVTARDRVVGYYCLATAAVRKEETPRRLAGDMPSVVPVILIGRLAVDEGQAGRGLGAGLLRDALSRALQVSQELGCRAVLVHAIDDGAVGFYQKFGFQAFPAEGRTLFLPIKTIADSLG